MRGRSASSSPAIDYRLLLARHGESYWWMVGMRRIVGAVAGGIAGRVLDMGCGPGWMLLDLPAQAWSVGVDRNIHALLALPEQPQSRGLRRAQADACYAPFPARSFDLVLALDLLEQQGVEPELVLREAYRLLVPGGRLLMRVPAHPWLFGPHDWFWGGARRYRQTELTALARSAGFAVRRTTYVNGLLFPFEVISRLFERAGLLSGVDLFPLPRLVNRALLSVLGLEARWLRAHDLPTGLSLLCVAERPAAISDKTGVTRYNEIS